MAYQLSFKIIAWYFNIWRWKSHKYLYFYSHDNYDYYCSQIHLNVFFFRPFTTPQVLRTGKKAQEDYEDEEEEDKVWLKLFLYYFKYIFVSYARLLVFLL